MKQILFALFLSVLAVTGVHAESDDRNPPLGDGTGAYTTNNDRKERPMPPEKMKNTEARMKEYAAREIERRIEALSKFNDQTSKRRRVTDETKSSLSETAQAQIDALNALKIKIENEDDPSELKNDLESIKKSYRTFALVIPKGAIIAAADRIKTTADLMQKLGEKLQTRINEAKKAGDDTTAMDIAYADFLAKLADAKVQAQAASDLVANLQQDNGDQTVAESNKKALIDARGKIKNGQTDLRIARQDAEKIVNGFKGKHRGLERKPPSTTATTN